MEDEASIQQHVAHQLLAGDFVALLTWVVGRPDPRLKAFQGIEAVAQECRSPFGLLEEVVPTYKPAHAAPFVVLDGMLAARPPVRVGKQAKLNSNREEGLLAASFQLLRDTVYGWWLIQLIGSAVFQNNHGIHGLLHALHQFLWYMTAILESRTLEFRTI